ncbi:putative transferase [Medicago truncatula]|uniref:Putative transferase n=1 Tax=Medicago truncatula TaxID=3880 RepID=A0A396JIF6_MEDTR|nr:putative transferase [Medicago truncatula]
MGVCFSAQVITEHPCHTGLNSNNKVSAVSVPQTAQTEGEILQSSNLKSYTYAELWTATGNFRPRNVLGEGDF